MTDQNTNDSVELGWNRRRVLEAAGAAGVAGLAGCAGKSGETTGTTAGDGSTTGSGSESGGTPVDPEFTLSEWLVPKDAQYNSFNAKNWPGDASRMLYDPLLKYNVEAGEFDSYLLTDWSIDGKTVELTVREQTWHDGDSVTAEDLVAQLKLEKYMGQTKFLDSAETTGERTAKLTLTDKINEDVFLETFRNKRLTVKKSLYEEKLKAFENASSEDEKSNAQAELSSWTLSEPVGNGPFEFEEATSQKFTLTKYEEHPSADSINFPKVGYKYYPSNQKRWQALMNDELDGQAQMFVPKNVRQKFPDSVVRARIPTNGGLGLTFQHDHKHFGQRKVRQAVAHVIDRSLVASNSGGDTKVPVETPCAVPGNYTGSVDEWLGDASGKFNKYETSEEKAASLLQSAGFEKQSGTWVDSDGETLKAPVKVPSGYTDWVTAAETIVSQLQDFGIDATVVSRNTSTFWGKDFGKGNFVLATGGWSARLHSHPYFHLKFQLDSWAASNVYNYPTEVSVSPLSDPDGESQTVAVPEKVGSLLKTEPGSETKNLVQELAWVVNQTLPVLPVQEKLAQSFVTNDDWKTPSADSTEMFAYWPTSWLARTGDLTAKTK